MARGAHIVQACSKCLTELKRFICPGCGKAYKQCPACKRIFREKTGQQIDRCSHKECQRLFNVNHNSVDNSGSAKGSR